MNWVRAQIKESNLVSPSQQSPMNFSSPNLQPDGFDLNSKISPSILLIIIILAIIFFISGLLHLLIRFLLRPQIREPDESENATALQGQLQQLFHLHDSGVDQSFIDALPVFHYKGIIGLKNPFDCAVCLCEFDPEDRLRLLPKCSHAFHMECIDTWLLSHSTCPLCRANLLHEFSTNNTCSPFVLVLESGSENSTELLTEHNSTNPILRTDSLLGLHGNSEIGSTRFVSGHKSSEIPRIQNSKPNSGEIPVESEKKVVPVKLGKFKYIIGEEGGSSNSNKDNARRCFSMGSFEYILDEDSILQVPVTMNMNLKKPLGQVGPGHRPVKSVCGCESFRKSRLESAEIAEETKGKRIVKNNQKESFSASKIWLRGKREKQSSSGEEGGGGRRAFSFRFPVNSNAFAGPDRDLIAESGDCNLRCENLESLQEKTPSFARRTMNWLAGRQNKVVHSSFTSNV